MLLCFIMNYPSLYGATYIENANIYEVAIVTNNYPDLALPILYNTNDLLLCIMIFCRIHFLLRAAINISEHKQPRAQRVCAIYGCDANSSYALKCIAFENLFSFILYATLTTVVVLAYCLRLFEQKC